MSQGDEFEGLVAGRVCLVTLGDFKLRAARIIEDEQAKASPDNALIDFACNAVRLAREYGDAFGDKVHELRTINATLLAKIASSSSAGDKHE